MSGPSPGSAQAAGYLRALPKVELHVHLVGSASVETVLRLSRRHPASPVPTDAESLRAFYEFTDFAHFIEVYVAVSSLVVSGEDVTDLVVGLAADLAASGVRYAEVTVTPYSHLLVGIAPAELTAALAAGRRRAADEHAVHLQWVFDVPGEYGPAAGLDTVAWVLDQRPSGTVGFGLGGPEVGFPRALFAEAFDRARAAGIPSVPHAGETTGPESVRSALDDLHAVRVGHGIAAAQDPALMERLRVSGVALEVCPTSNLRTGAVPSMDRHPLPRLVAAGVPVTLASDDPGMFATTLTREYEVAHEVLGLSLVELTEIARTGVRVSFAPAGLKAAVLAEIDAVAAAHGVR
jgi:aminodeoxyfutalosine deaminase